MYAAGRFPDALRTTVTPTWAYIQAGLDRARATLLGRRSHEASRTIDGGYPPRHRVWRADGFW